MVKQTKEKKMINIPEVNNERFKTIVEKPKFVKVGEQDFTAWRENPRPYLVWENTHNNKIVIKKMRGTKNYILENLYTCEMIEFDNLESAKRVGLKLWK